MADVRFPVELSPKSSGLKDNDKLLLGDVDNSNYAVYILLATLRIYMAFIDTDETVSTDGEIALFAGTTADKIKRSQKTIVGTLSGSASEVPNCKAVKDVTDLKANTADVYSKTEADAIFISKADNDNVVDLTSDQSITGEKTFVNGANIGNVSNDEIQQLNGVTSNIQSQLNAKIESSEKGSALGVAELDSNGLVPNSQLPSYVDDVIEVDDYASLPVTGETGKIYVTLDDNLTYRWSGSIYVEISKSLALGETSNTAYRGDKGKTAYDHSQLTFGNPHNVTKSDVGLSNVTNDAQLKRADGDFNSFTEDTDVLADDIFLFEDSSASFVKKKVKTKYIGARVAVGENLLDNSNFINCSTYGYGVLPEDWFGYLAYAIQGGFPECTKEQLLYALGIADSELEGLWNLNEASGDAVDLSSNNITLSNENFATVQNYLMKNSRQSTIENQYVYTTSISNLLPSTELLWGLNFRYGQLNKDGGLVGLDNGTSTEIHYLKVVGNKVVFSLNGLSTSLTSDVILEQDKSYHIVAGYASNTLYLWINGILKTASVTGSINNTGIARFTIGAGVTSGTCFGTYQNVFITSAFRDTPYIKNLWTNCGYKGVKVLPSTPSQGAVFQSIRKTGGGNTIFNRLYGKHFTIKAKMYQFVAETGYIACADAGVLICQSALTSVVNEWVDISATYLGNWSEIVDKIDINLLCLNNSNQVYYKDVMIYEGETPVAFWNASQNDWQRFPRLMRIDPPKVKNGYSFEEGRWYNTSIKPEGSAGSIGTYAEDTSGYKRFMIKDKELKFKSSARITNKGSWSGSFIHDLPVVPSVNIVLTDCYIWGGIIAIATNPANTSRGLFKVDFTNGKLVVVKSENTAPLQWSDIAVDDTYWIDGSIEID